MEQLYSISRYEEHEDIEGNETPSKTEILNILLSSAKCRKQKYEIEQKDIKNEGQKLSKEISSDFSKALKTGKYPIFPTLDEGHIVKKCEIFETNSNSVKKRKKIKHGNGEDATEKIDDLSNKNDKFKKRKKHRHKEESTVDQEQMHLEIHDDKNISIINISSDDICASPQDISCEHKHSGKKKKKRSENKEKKKCLAESSLEIIEHDIKEHKTTDYSDSFVDKAVIEPESSRKEMDEVSNYINLSSDDTADINLTEGEHDENEGFLRIGEVQGHMKEKVKRILPDWLTNPTVINADLQKKDDLISDYNHLDPCLIQSLKNCGITHLFPVQKAVIPWLLNNFIKVFCFRSSDLCVSAPTGSGKTLAFVVPIIQTLKERVVCAVRAVVVLPVRDLAFQVFKVFEDFCKGTTLRTILVVGQNSFAHEQFSLVRKGTRRFHSLADIIVATPGRLVDHINRTEGFSLKMLRFLIIDEADRMMEEMQHGWLTEVEKAVFGENCLPSGCCCNSNVMHQKYPVGPLTACSFSHISEPLQKLLYSATLSQDPEKLQQLSLFHPVLFTSLVKNKQSDNNSNTDNVLQQEAQGEFIGKYSTPAELKEYYTVCNTSIKPLIVWYLVKRNGFKRVLCFTHSLESTHRLRLVLEQLGNFKVREFSSTFSGISQKITLGHFTSGKIDILVCSDAMARGMDIKNVDCVISYDPPKYVKNYIHRIGRTARAGRHGVAITILQRKNVKKFLNMVNAAGKSQVKNMHISPSHIEPHQEQYRIALAAVAKIVEKERKTQFQKFQRRSKQNKKHTNKTRIRSEIKL